MPERILSHFKRNFVAYLALFVALGGSSYAAARLAPASVTSRALANRSVTHAKLARNAITAGNVRNQSLTSSDFQAGAVLKGLKGDAGQVGSRGLSGINGLKGDAGPAGPRGPAGQNGSSSVGPSPRLTSQVTAPHGASTSVPINNTTWTQQAGELDLITGTLTLKVPASCTGSFGNALIVSVDGTAKTYAVAPTAPAGGTVSMPLSVGTLSPSDTDAAHTLSAALGNSCTGSGEDYAVTGLKLDVVKFH